MKQYFIVALVVLSVYSQLLIPSNIPALIENNKQLEERFKEQLVLPRSNGETRNAGYIQIKKDSQSALHYVFYNARAKPVEEETKTPIILWLSGGPGCSSAQGNFLEIGPHNITKKQDGTLEEQRRNVSWNDDYHLLFVDQPVGTGYSVAKDTGDLAKNSDDIAEHFYTALQNFFKNEKFSKFVNNDLYIFGEDYAGHYIPVIASYILEQNKKESSTKIQLKGVGIGDAWTDPINQLSENGLFGYALGLLDDLERQEVESNQLQGVLRIRNNDYDGALTNFDNLIEIIKRGAGGADQYNYRNFTTRNYNDIENYLNSPVARELYNVDNELKTFKRCNTGVYNNLKNDFMRSFANKLPSILEQIPVLLYQGQDDLIVNTPSSQNWISKIQWTKQSEFNDKDFTIWKLQDKVVGLAKNVDNLTFVVVNKAGQAVPQDQPASSYDMIKKFINKSAW